MVGFCALAVGCGPVGNTVQLVPQTMINFMDISTSGIHWRFVTTRAA